jgi:hypothetical protein
MFIAIFVDDMLVIAPDRATVDEIKREIGQKFDIKDLSPVN